MAARVIDPYNEPHFPEARANVPGPRASSIAGLAPKRKRTLQEAADALHDQYGRAQFLMDDFRQFLVLVWEFLGLPEPSDVQLAIAYWLQHGPDRAIILGFRGVAKSWITATYALWRLYCNPETKVLIVSASLERAVASVQWMLALIREMPELKFLEPGTFQRSSGKAFDVGPATPSQSPSVRGAGISSQMAGSRADVIIPDDVEIPTNSMTTVMREKIGEAVKEFDAILLPGGQVKFLGTPQVDDSLYVKLQKRGYVCRIWPARYPGKKMRLKYGDRLSPLILDRVIEDPTLEGHSVWSARFSDSDLDARELSYGRSGFALQFMLDTSLADQDRYPLKLRDLIITGLDYETAPDTITWGNGPELIISDLPSLGFEGDRFHRPAFKSEVYSKFNSIRAGLDTSGRGSNETAMSVVSELNARLFLLSNQGWRDGYGPATLNAIAAECVRLRVQELYIEDNFGDGMFTNLLAPVLEKAWAKFNAGKPEGLRGGTDIVAVHSSHTQKELRLLSILEPATQQHRLVVSEEVIEKDKASIEAMAEDIGQENIHHYSLVHQYTHLSREKDSLIQDDRIESLAIVVSSYAELLGVDPHIIAARREEDRTEQMLEELFEDADDVGQYAPSPKPWNRAKNPVRPR